MAKNFQLEIAHNIPRRSRRARFVKAALIFVCAALVIPVLVEAGKILVSRWYDVMGKPYIARTPILDAIQARMEGAQGDFWDIATPFVNSMQWDASVAFPVLAVVMVVAMMLLRH
jgi:hypothetical protein